MKIDRTPLKGTPCEHGCKCPRGASRCKYWMLHDAKVKDFSRGHGGWGWPTVAVMVDGERKLMDAKTAHEAGLEGEFIR